MCFQCGETDCERYESEPPKWVKELEESQLLAALNEEKE